MVVLADLSVANNIIIGCTQLDIIKGYQQLEELFWLSEHKSWILRFNIELQELNDGNIPYATNWYMLIDPLYPRGSISIYPDKIYGIKQTYQHMNQNIEVDNLPWRLGKICTDWDNNQLELLSDTEEMMDAKYRISWHVERLKNWILAAFNDSLAEKGAYFELPHAYLNKKPQIIFAEEQEEFGNWINSRNRSGFISLKNVNAHPDIFFVCDFFDKKNQIIKKYNWGRIVTEEIETKLHSGVWVLLPFQPIIHPWTYPKTIGDLEEVCKKNHFNIWNEVYELMHKIRKEGQQIYLLIGFQIPKLVGDESLIIHWISIGIRALTKKVKKVKGFRKEIDYYFQLDRLNSLHSNQNLNYIYTDNWSKEAILSRGSIDKKTYNDGIFLIGAGALGSSISEMLSRLGISKIVICDDDILEMGNLSRHTLGVNHLFSSKAKALSDKINQNSVHAWSFAINKKFPNLNEQEMELLEQQEIIIDTTGSDAVIDYLHSFDWTIPKRFISISVGFGAKRVFIFLSNKTPFPRKEFYNFIKPWIELEKKENKDIILPRDGIGCYHPLFPARSDDITLMSSLAIKEIEAWWIQSHRPSIFAVYEQQYSNGKTTGVLLKQHEVF